VARTFQHGEVPPQMTVVDAVLAGRHTRIRMNVFAEMLSLPVARRRDAAHRDAVLDILRLCDLEKVAGRPVGSLPFGTQKIIGTARALAAEPAILLLDEPSAGLTQEEREAMARLIMRTKHTLGVPIVWIEHDMQMVADLADRIHVLDYGRSLADGPPEDVLANPEVVAAYLGA